MPYPDGGCSPCNASPLATGPVTYGRRGSGYPQGRGGKIRGMTSCTSSPTVSCLRSRPTGTPWMRINGSAWDQGPFPALAAHRAARRVGLRAMNSSWRILAPFWVSTEAGEDQDSAPSITWTFFMASGASVLRRSLRVTRQRRCEKRANLVERRQAVARAAMRRMETRAPFLPPPSTRDFSSVDEWLVFQENRHAL
jgi:hypothetical protein